MDCKALYCGSAGKEFACKVGNVGSVIGLGKCPREAKGYPLQYSGLESVHGVKELDTTERLSLITDTGLMSVFPNRSVHSQKQLFFFFPSATYFFRGNC